MHYKQWFRVAVWARSGRCGERGAAERREELRLGESTVVMSLCAGGADPQLSPASGAAEAERIAAEKAEQERLAAEAAACECAPARLSPAFNRVPDQS